MTKRCAFLTALAAAVGLAAAAAAAHAGTNASRLTYLTFSRPVALPGVSLTAGTYAFELADSTGAANVVVVRNRARTQVHFLGFTNRVARPRSMREVSAVTFGEAAKGEPTPIDVWYPPDMSDGLQFIYRR
ncbi:MAG TPA: hypothetical protein VKD69_00425 [Vicinamibacterales bacterium]|nr:hypothetical protein [Vicinamibacterales bacterium]